MELQKQDESSSSDRGEFLSSLMDDEFNDSVSDGLVEKMVGDEQLLNKWQSYHLIRDVMQNEQASLCQTADVVSKRLESEPCISGMRKECKAKASTKRFFDWQQWWRPAAGLAFASTLFIFVGQFLNQEDGFSTQSLAVQESPADMPTRILISDALPLDENKRMPSTLVREHFIEHRYTAPLRNSSNAKLVGYDPNAQ